MTGSMLTRPLADELVRDLAGSSGDAVSVIAPFTAWELYRLPHATVDEVQQAARRARDAQEAWWAAGPAHRRRVLLRGHDLLLERREQLLDAVQSETGKTRGQAFEEVFNAAATTRYTARTAHRAIAGGGRRAGIPALMRARVRVAPKGLVGVITPWNYPLALAAMDVIPALATGNAVLQKADDQGALSVLLARRAFVDAGLPPELWAVVTGPGAEVGSAVVDEADYVCFTGSTATGRTVAQRAAGRLIGASMELGGKNPLIVLDDVNPEKAAADAAYGCFSAAGQLCVSIERIYVEQGVADRFIPAFADRVAGLALGTSFDFTADVGSLASAAQLERVTAHLEDAVAKGATVLAGGHHRPDLAPFMLEPTVLTGVTDDMACYRGETFGPVVAIEIVDSAEQAIARANDTEYGLNASVMAGSRRRAREVAERLHAGSVNINEGYRASFGSVDAPMGGVKQSGLGRRNGIEGLQRFVEASTIGETTGLMQLPRTGYEFSRLTGLMVFLLKTLKAVGWR
ncbi:succinic semialdehyde dehydrogenase [Salinibacterium sp. ZJ77]|uniref:succinic semialdehyde dehydrogenase n=1 Tax=Salinibacterium sp. ZJ77 TaxID=2708337 RepID=UPI00142275C5|nr:succinic semialdehyde dehydrogenase [Salinibacterium sp. ZJ77]